MMSSKTRERNLVNMEMWKFIQEVKEKAIKLEWSLKKGGLAQKQIDELLVYRHMLATQGVDTLEQSELLSV